MYTYWTSFTVDRCSHVHRLTKALKHFTAHWSHRCVVAFSQCSQWSVVAAVISTGLIDWAGHWWLMINDLTAGQQTQDKRKHFTLETVRTKTSIIFHRSLTTFSKTLIKVFHLLWTLWHLWKSRPLGESTHQFTPENETVKEKKKSLKTL